ncbi:hypothetical protein [Nocardia niigatensis]
MTATRFGSLSYQHVGRAITYHDGRRKRTAKLAGVERKSGYLIAYIDTGYITDQPLTLPNDAEVTVGP